MYLFQLEAQYPCLPLMHEHAHSSQSFVPEEVKEKDDDLHVCKLAAWAEEDLSQY